MSAHILIIENDFAIQELIALNLASAGHRVSRAADAETALLLIEENLPEMIVLDWTLPGQSGLSLVRRLRAGTLTRDVPIIMVTARSAEQDKVLALESGADDYIDRKSVV